MFMEKMYTYFVGGIQYCKDKKRYFIRYRHIASFLKKRELPKIKKRKKEEDSLQNPNPSELGEGCCKVPITDILKLIFLTYYQTGQLLQNFCFYMKTKEKCCEKEWGEGGTYINTIAIKHNVEKKQLLYF